MDVEKVEQLLRREKYYREFIGYLFETNNNLSRISPNILLQDIQNYTGKTTEETLTFAERLFVEGAFTGLSNEHSYVMSPAFRLLIKNLWYEELHKIKQENLK